MKDRVEFYFDFSSPYGYFASLRIDRIAERANRVAAWKPIMLGSVFKETGSQPLITIPIKGEYCRKDWDRLGRLYNVPWVLPDPHPITTLAASRAFYWIDEQDPDLAKAFATAAFHAHFGEGRDISPVNAVADVAEPLGISRTALRSALADERWKKRLKDEGGGAIAKGVCGAPFFIVDGEGFWGCDRMEMMEKWMAEGGW